MTLARFCLADLAPMPWKNGGGATREIACWPAGAGLDDFDARVSVATLAADGPFSCFAGVDRSITLLSGDGVHLRGPGVDHRLVQVGAPFAFDGALPLQAALLGGASEDFNVMARRSRCQADVRAWTAATDWRLVDGGVLLAARGAWQVGGAARGHLGAGEGLRWQPATAGVLHCTPASGDSPLLLAVSLTRAGREP